jgi:hypothetical protein
MNVERTIRRGRALRQVIDKLASGSEQQSMTIPRVGVLWFRPAPNRPRHGELSKGRFLEARRSA